MSIELGIEWKGWVWGAIAGTLFPDTGYQGTPYVIPRK
jgi:hypothetical protein